MRADALPKLREIPIRGDVIQTLRLERGWENPQLFCKLAKLSRDRLASLEQGGEKVYKKTLIRLARTLSVEWQALVDWEAIDRNGSGDPHSTRQPDRGKHTMLIEQSDESADSPLNVSDLVRIFSEIASSKGKIVSVAVSDGKLTVGLEITDAAAIQFAASYFDAPLDKGKLISATLLLDYRVAGQVIAGGGYASKLRTWFNPRYRHFVKVAKIKLNIVKIKRNDLPIFSQYYFYKYKGFENRLYQAIANGISGKASPRWFRHIGQAVAAVEFRPERVGLSELTLQDNNVLEVDWLDVNRLARNTAEGQDEARS